MDHITYYFRKEFVDRERGRGGVNRSKVIKTLTLFTKY